MRLSSVVLIVLGLTLVISLTAIWFYPTVQDFMAGNAMWNGLKAFGDEFSANQINSLDDLPDPPDKSALIAIPYLDYTNDELAKIRRFVENGGTLLLMDDYGFGNRILEYLRVPARFTNRPLLDPLFSYKNQFMPRITDFAPGVKEDGIDVIMFNHGTSIINVTDTEKIAWSSAASFADSNENRSRDPDEPLEPSVVAAELRFGKGKLVLVADPSVLINTMVGRDKNHLFIGYLAGEKQIVIDFSHLTRTPLDVSKTRLLAVREVISSPYALVGITAVIFLVVSRYTLSKGETVGQY